MKSFPRSDLLSPLNVILPEIVSKHALSFQNCFRELDFREISFIFIFLLRKKRKIFWQYFISGHFLSANVEWWFLLKKKVLYLVSDGQYCILICMGWAPITWIEYILSHPQESSVEVTLTISISFQEKKCFVCNHYLSLRAVSHSSREAFMYPPYSIHFQRISKRECVKFGQILKIHFNECRLPLTATLQKSLLFKLLLLGLGVPSFTKYVVFLNIVQKAVDPPLINSFDQTMYNPSHKLCRLRFLGNQKLLAEQLEIIYLNSQIWKSPKL